MMGNLYSAPLAMQARPELALVFVDFGAGLGSESMLILTQ